MQSLPLKTMHPIVASIRAPGNRVRCASGSPRYHRSEGHIVGAAVLAVCGCLALLEEAGGDGTHGTRVGAALRNVLASRKQVGAGQVHMVYKFSQVSTLVCISCLLH